MNDIAIYVPNYNNETCIKKMRMLDGFDYILMDNCSTDRSVEMAIEKGMVIIQNDNNVDRTSNWLRCLEHFRTSRYQWMKWLFTGDEMSDNAYDIINQSISQFPEASMIVFNYMYRDVKVCQERRSKYQNKEIDCSILVKDLLKGDNIFGSPIGILISKRAVESCGAIELHDFTWAADVYIHYQLSKKGKVAFADKIVGCFIADNRKHYKKLQSSLQIWLEGLELIRVIAEQNHVKFDEGFWYDTAVKDHLLQGLSYNPKHPLFGKVLRRYLYIIRRTK